MAAVLYAPHQDVWFWREARPLVLGFVPIDQFHQAAYTMAASGLIWSLVRTRWPAHLDRSSRE